MLVEKVRVYRTHTHTLTQTHMQTYNPTATQSFCRFIVLTHRRPLWTPYYLCHCYVNSIQIQHKFRLVSNGLCKWTMHMFCNMTYPFVTQ